MKVRLDTRQFTRLVDDLDDMPQTLREEATEYFRDSTPLRTGNARRKTKLKGDTIQADYPYAGRLDSGYSRQAPSGMTEPTTRYIQNRIDQLTRRAR